MACPVTDAGSNVSLHPRAWPARGVRLRHRAPHGLHLGARSRPELTGERTREHPTASLLTEAERIWVVAARLTREDEVEAVDVRGDLADHGAGRHSGIAT